MPPISLAAIALAFAVEWLADFIIGTALFLVFAPELPASGTTPAEIQRHGATPKLRAATNRRGRA